MARYIKRGRGGPRGGVEGRLTVEGIQLLDGSLGVDDKATEVATGSQLWECQTTGAGQVQTNNARPAGSE